MGFLSAYTGSVRVKVGPADQDYWVDLKKYVTQGSQEAAESALVQVVVVGDDAKPMPDVAKYRKLMVFAAIEDWNLDDENGQKMEISIKSIQKLPIPVFNQLWEQVKKNNSEAERSREEQLDFRQ